MIHYKACLLSKKKQNKLAHRFISADRNTVFNFN